MSSISDNTPDNTIYIHIYSVPIWKGRSKYQIGGFIQSADELKTYMAKGDIYLIINKTFICKESCFHVIKRLIDKKLANCLIQTINNNVSYYQCPLEAIDNVINESITQFA